MNTASFRSEQLRRQSVARCREISRLACSQLVRSSGVGVGYFSPICKYMAREKLNFVLKCELFTHFGSCF